MGSEADAEFTSNIMDALNVIADHVQNSPASLARDDITHITTCISECFAKAWDAHAFSPRILVWSKGWWDVDCVEAWHRYKESDCSSNEWHNMRHTMKNAKRKYFNKKIEHIASNNKWPWDLMSWVRAPKPDSSEAIVLKGKPCLSIEDSWNAFQETFNSMQSRPTYPSQLGQALHPKPKREWAPFSVHELNEALVGCLGRSAPGPDHVTWTHIKRFCTDEHILRLFAWIINSCFAAGFWPDCFKTSKTVIIPKPGKPAYNIPKVFHPIVLLNTLGKLFEKVIANRLQWEAACFELGARWCT